MTTYTIRTKDELIYEVEADTKADALDKIPAEDRHDVVSVTAEGEQPEVRPVFITGNRNGYDPEGCGRTMTVGELIAFLSDFDEDRPIYLRNDNGYTYGSITERDICDPDDE